MAKKAKSKANKSKPKKPASITSQDIIDEQSRKKNIADYEMAKCNYFDNEKNLIKQLMTACLLAIGLLVSVLENKINDNWFLFTLWISANVLFLFVFFILLKNIRIISELFVNYSKQANLLDENDPVALSNIQKEVKKNTAKLKKDNPRIFWGFYIAVLTSVVFVLSTNAFFSGLVNKFLGVIKSFYLLIFDFFIAL